MPPYMQGYAPVGFLKAGLVMMISPSALAFMRERGAYHLGRDCRGDKAVGSWGIFFLNSYSNVNDLTSSRKVQSEVHS